jgi:nickel/cobalt transporter (NicO) family protein
MEINHITPHGVITKIIFLYILFISFFLIPQGHAHQFSDFDQFTGITILNTSLEIEYRIWYGTPLVPGLGLDLDRDGQLTEEELYLFLEKTDQSIQANLHVSADYEIKKLVYQSGTISGSGQYPVMAITIALWYKVPIKHLEKQTRELSVTDNNFKEYGPDRKLYYINADSDAGNIQASKQEYTRKFKYTQGKEFGIRPEPGSRDISRPSSEERRLTAFLNTKTLNPAMLVLAFGTAFLLGAGHALSPGHGKAMVAAYLVGSRGKKKDAVALGLIVTFTHVISVIVLGIIVLYLSNSILPEQIYPWLSVSSGMLIFMVGLFLLIRQSMGPHHSHGHGHSHPGPDTKITPPSLGSLFSLGIAGGIVPCPSAIVVLLVSITLNKIALGLGIILVFSLGLAAVLIGIGIMVVSISSLSTGINRLAPIVRIMPVISACLILILGISITFHALISTGLIYTNFL